MSQHKQLGCFLFEFGLVWFGFTDVPKEFGLGIKKF